MHSILYCISCGSDKIQTNRNGIPCCEVCGRTYRESSGDYSKELNGIMRLRQDRDFKGAKKGCENLLQTHFDSSEAYWQEMLSDFGIVYDYESGKPIFCYSAEEYESSKGSIKRDPNYQNALRVANDDDKRYYISQAEELDSLLKELLHKKKKEETYLQFSKKQKTVRNVILIVLLVAALIGAGTFGIVKLRDHQMKMESEKRVQETISAIGSIESEITYADLEAIKAAENLYKQLSEEEKSSVGNYSDLMRAREEYDALIAWANANPMTVSFDARGGNLSNSTMQVNYGSPYGALPIATKTGYQLDGWFSVDTDIQVTNETIVAEKQGHTLYAKWSPQSYSIHLVTNGGTITSDDVTSYTFGTGATLPTNVTRSGYLFAGWYTENEGAGEFCTSISTADVGEKVFYADWIECLNDTQNVTYRASTKTLTVDLSSYQENGELSRSGFSYSKFNNGVLTIHPIDDGREIEKVVLKGSYGKRSKEDGRIISKSIDGFSAQFENWNNYINVVIEDLSFSSDKAFALSFPSSANVNLEIIGASIIRNTVEVGGGILGSNGGMIGALSIRGSGSIEWSAGKGKRGDNGGICITSSTISLDFDGTVDLYGGTGGDGENAKTQTNACAEGHAGGDGGTGGFAIYCDTLIISDKGQVNLYGGQGGIGGNGGQGGQGTTNAESTFDYHAYGIFGAEIQSVSHYNEAYAGGNGGRGGNGGTGGAPIHFSNFESSNDSITLSFGNGGNGGKGGTGGTGGHGHDYYGVAGGISYLTCYDPGKGGKGGNGGRGGDAGNVFSKTYELDEAVKVDPGSVGTPGEGGEGGQGGIGGSGGRTSATANEHTADKAENGQNGDRGPSGN